MCWLLPPTTATTNFLQTEYSWGRGNSSHSIIPPLRLSISLFVQTIKFLRSSIPRINFLLANRSGTNENKNKYDDLKEVAENGIVVFICFSWRTESETFIVFC